MDTTPNLTYDEESGYVYDGDDDEWLTTPEEVFMAVFRRRGAHAPDTDARTLAELVLDARRARYAHITGNDEPMTGETWEAWMAAMTAAEDMAGAIRRAAQEGKT